MRQRAGLFIFLTMIPFYFYAQQRNGYTIDGYIKGLEEGEKVVMRLSYNKAVPPFIQQFENRDSAYVKDGKFHLSGIVPEGPRRYWMIFDRHSRDRIKVIDLVIDNNEKIVIRCDSNLDNIEHGYIQHYVSIEGSPSNYAYSTLLPARDLYRETMRHIKARMQKVQDSLGFDKEIVGQLIELKKLVSNSLYYLYLKGEGRDPEIKRSSLFWLADFDHESFWPEVYNSLDADKKNSFLGKWLQEVSILCVGQKFPEFTLPSTDGKLLNVYSEVKKGRVTIVHFWAAQSYRRKQHEDELRILYKQYHDKGLNIIGISSDNSEHAYKKAVATDRFPWENVSDLEGEDGIVNTVYREYGIYSGQPMANTTNVVLDTEGNIIAWDVSGVELQYYLSKYLDDDRNSKLNASRKTP